MAQLSDLPPLTWLRAFEAAARHLSFTLAAQELNLTQSAISQHVRNLEARLGLELFLRRPRGLTLTEAGTNYLPIVREAFALLADGTRTLTGGDRGQVIRLNCNITFATWWLAPRLGALKARYPWLSVNIKMPIWLWGMADPVNTDAEIRFGRSSDMSDKAMPIIKETVTPVCAPGFADGQPDWRRDPLFDCSGILTSWQSWAAAHGEQLPDHRRIDLASTYVVSVTAAANGQGLALAQEYMIEGLSRTTPLLTPWECRLPLQEIYFFVPPPPHAETPATRAFQDWLYNEVPMHDP